MNLPEAVDRAYFEALISSDLDGVLALFADDGALMAVEAVTSVGADQLRRQYAGTFQAIGFGRKLYIDWILEEADLASAQTHTAGTIKLLSTGTTIGW